LILKNDILKKKNHVVKMKPQTGSHFGKRGRKKNYFTR